MPLDFGLALSAGPDKGKVSQWLEDLDVGLPRLKGKFKSLWMTDHFFWNDDPTYEAWTVLAFLAARYPRYDLGPMVLGQSYRNPALIAKSAATLQALCNGRFIMGIGAGWKEDEYRAYNYDYPAASIRIEQLEDTLEIMKRMWTEPGPISYQGKHYQVKNAYCEPRPVPVPPIIVGGGGAKTMRLAARYADMWNVSDKSFPVYKERLDILKAHCAELGRDLSTLRISWFGRLGVARTEAEALAYSNGKWNKDNALVGTPSQVVEMIQQFVSIGVDYFMINILGFPHEDVMGLVLEDVLAKVQK